MPNHTNIEREINDANALISNFEHYINIQHISSAQQPPIVQLFSPDFINNTANIYIDTGAEITLIKSSTLKLNFLNINYNDSLLLRGVTSGLCRTIGSAYISLENIDCKIHIVPDTFPIQFSGLLGYDTLNQFKGKINIDKKQLELPHTIIPFISNNTFKIPAKTRQIIYAIVKNSEVNTGFVELQDLAPNLLFGNFIGTNRNGIVYAFAVNISDSDIEIEIPTVFLEPYEEVANKDEIFDLPNIFDDIHLNKNQILHLDSYEIEQKDRATLVFEQLDPLSLKHLNEEEILHVKELIRNFAHIFALPGEKLKTTHLVKHEIHLTSDIPFKAKRYRQPPEIQKALQNEVDSLLEQGILKKSTSPYCSPTWVIKKKGDPNKPARYRLITDFRKLNELTQPSTYPIPMQIDIIDSVSNAKYITCLDLQSGYYQIPMHEDHAKYTAFSTNSGHYEYTRLGMGLRFAPGTFQRLVNLVLNGIIGTEAFVYLDDIILSARTLN